MSGTPSGGYDHVVRALSFGSVADEYHRHRPGYPEEVVDRVLAHADGPVRRALEVGAGTGKATAVFAARGIDVVAVEPDPGMRAVLAEVVAGLPVEVVAGSFESVDLGAVGPVDLVYAAAAFHWTDPGKRWRRAADALRPGGVLAVFGCARDLADDALRSTVDAITADHVDPGHAGLGWTLETVAEQPWFTDAVAATLARRVSMPADDYLAHLATVSAYRVLADDARADLLVRVRAALPDVVEVAEDVPLHLARRVDRGSTADQDAAGHPAG